MAANDAVLRDPDSPSTDSSEDSWTFLDEMDEPDSSNLVTNESVPTSVVVSFRSENQMNEAASVVTSSSPTASSMTLIELATEAVPASIKNNKTALDAVTSTTSALEEIEKIATSVTETPTTNDDDVSDDDAAAAATENGIHDCRTVEPLFKSYGYSDLTDGSTTDGSISILGDDEFRQEPEEETEELDTDNGNQTLNALRSSQPSQLWLRCQQPDLRFIARPIHSRPFEYQRCAPPSSVAELGMPKRDVVDDFAGCLERINKYLANSYLFNLLLLLLTGCSFAIFAILYSRYLTHNRNIDELEQKLYNMQLEKTKVDAELDRCRYQFELEVKQNTQEKNEAISVAANENERPPNDATKTVWTGDGASVEPMEISPENTKEFSYENACDDKDDLYSDYNREFCQQNNNQKGVSCDDNSDCENEMNEKTEFDKKHHHHHRRHNGKKVKKNKRKDVDAYYDEFEKMPFDPNVKFIDPNEFNDDLSPYAMDFSREDIDDMYGYPCYDSSDEDCSTESALANNSDYEFITIDDILWELDQHLNELTYSCYEKYQQLKEENIFNADATEKAQKKLQKQKKKMNKYKDDSSPLSSSSSSSSSSSEERFDRGEKKERREKHRREKKKEDRKNAKYREKENNKWMRSITKDDAVTTTIKLKMK